ncbi:MAG: tRNA 2-thiouridine(34) synthase MnmA [Actinomycetota bacterium]
MTNTGPVMVAMSGGVDSSVAAALLMDAGHDVVGVTMKLWGGPSDTGCCAVSDVDDARRVADRLGIEHHVFNFGEDFERDVIEPYVADHAAGRTPNPCIECNRHLKFDRLVRRADALGFDRIATGHHARVVQTSTGPRLGRGVDGPKDQAYVLHVIEEPVLQRLLLPVGELTKADVRRVAADLDLRTAQKPESQDVCFITNQHGRGAFLGDRIPLKPAAVVDRAGEQVGSVPSVELVTIGQRKGLGLAGGTDPRYVIDVGPDESGTQRVTIGAKAELVAATTTVESWRWVGAEPVGPLTFQCSAHGTPEAGSFDGSVISWEQPHRRIAPGQSVVAFAVDPTTKVEYVAGGGIAGRTPI